ncbi:uncharacterized protein BN769_00604 [Prevotella sp. CAG:732]|nr:uncharacterized protein BN769_00604 [Prevotella sp. CAG:732]
MSQGDWFYKMFLGHYCLGEQCVKACKYKYDKSSADIRIGDLWGNTYKEDEKGVSALVTFTEKGKMIVESLKNATLVSQPLEVVAEGQMKDNARPVPVSSLVMYLFEHRIYLNLKQWNFVLALFGKPFRAYAKLKRIFKIK